MPRRPQNPILVEVLLIVAFGLGGIFLWAFYSAGYLKLPWKQTIQSSNSVPVEEVRDIPILRVGETLETQINGVDVAITLLSSQFLHGNEYDFRTEFLVENQSGNAKVTVVKSQVFTGIHSSLRDSDQPQLSDDSSNYLTIEPAFKLVIVLNWNSGAYSGVNKYWIGIECPVLRSKMDRLEAGCSDRGGVFEFKPAPASMSL